LTTGTNNEGQLTSASLLKSHLASCPQIAYAGLTYTVPAPAPRWVRLRLPNAGCCGGRRAYDSSRSMAADATAGATKAAQRLHVLRGLHGRLAPGSMTLVLAPPGAGKTAFLRALAGRLREGSDAELRGAPTYNGVAAATLAAEGTHLCKLVSFAHQNDVHLPQLTVRETLAFAAANLLPSSTHPAAEATPGLSAAMASRVDEVISVLDLADCADTPVGSDVVRGISGGQRKRLTVAEALVALPRVALLDEVTTGLDSAVALRLVAAVRTWTTAAGATTVAALLQPSPELLAL
jgi:ABC-type multidrug transport system ATPase subunit